MLKKYLSKFTIDIVPSIVATIIGAYIVNYYIVPRAREATQPKPAAVVAAPAREAARPVEAVSLTEPVEAKADDDKPAGDKPAPKLEAPEPRKHQPAAREKAASSEERRNATDLARAAIARLRGPNPQETSRIEAAVAPAQTQPMPVALQPLPPAVIIAMPKTETIEQHGNADTAGISARDVAHRPLPPGEIPSLPLDLRAHLEAERSRAAVMADDIVSVTKSMFNAVIPR